MNDRNSRNRVLMMLDGFSLIELLAVIAITTILTVAVLPGIQSTTKSTELGIAATTLVNEIRYCRAEAAGLNCPVELCLLRKTDADAGCFEQFRSRILEQDGSSRWITSIKTLPEGIAVSSDMNLSNILGSQQAQIDAQGREEIFIRIDPSGEMQLGAPTSNLGTAPLYMTLAGKVDLVRYPGKLPRNFATIQIDNRNSQATVLRP